MDRTEEGLYFATHCASCGKKDNKWMRVIYCGECFHPYAIPVLGLVWHDLKVRVSINWKKPKYIQTGSVTIWDDMVQQKWKYRFKSLIPRRIRNIWCCPCCVHDL